MTAIFSSRRRVNCAALVAFAAALLSVASARAETFMLHTGGQVRGELLNKVESPRKRYIVQTPQGMTVTLDANQVRSLDLQSAPDEEYEKIRPTFADTAEDQWKLAEWCREHQLMKAREATLEHVLELQPDHKQARAALGYSQENGQWALREQIMQARGYERVNGKWLTQQEIEILKRRTADDRRVKDWFVTVNRLRKWIGDGAKHEIAVAEIRQINDPSAVAALTQALENEEDRATRMLFVDALGRIGAPSLNTLIKYALDDADSEIRYHCLQQLIRNPSHRATEEFVKVLRHKDNELVNRAGAALGQLKDKSAIAPLIDALVTTHRVVEASGGNNQMSAGFSPNGGGSFTAGSSVKVHNDIVQNQRVLDGLVTLAEGPNFGFDKAAWRRWYSTQTRTGTVDTRRD